GLPFASPRRIFAYLSFARPTRSPNMNWKLILSLSLVGIVVAVLSLFGLTRHIEPLLWLVIFICYAWIIARRIPSRHFLHGFLVSVANGVWIAIIHSAFLEMYVTSNPEALEGFQKMQIGGDPRMLMLVLGPIFGAVFGIVSGLFAFVAARMLSRKPEA